MALDNTRLGSAIAMQVQAARPADGSELSNADLTAIWQQVAQEIIDEIKNNAVVTVQTADGPAMGTIQ